jgi:hypothetical protein
MQNICKENWSNQARRSRKAILFINYSVIYTIDLDLSLLKIEEEDEENVKVIDSKLKRYVVRQERKAYYEQAMNCEFSVWNDFLENDIDFKLVNRKFTPEFYQEYNIGFDCFIDGKWEEARSHFESSNAEY